MSFGTLSKFYKNMKNEDKKSIADIYDLKYIYLESWIENISFVRNVCAHYGRLYNAKISKMPKLYDEYKDMEISNSSIFSTILCLKYVLPNDRYWIEFVDLIRDMFDKYEDVDIKTMGFVEEWYELLIR